MKILFCMFPGNDYGHNSLYDGLCRSIGAENVLEYPQNPAIHDSSGGHRYPSYFDYPVLKTDEEKLKMVEDGEFDYIFMGVRSKNSYAKPNDPRILLYKFSEVVSRNKGIPYVLIDQSDTRDIDDVAVDELKPIKYFKREYFVEDNWPELVKPLTFGFSEKYCPEKIDTQERLNDVFWAGKRYAHREPYIKLIEEHRGGSFFDNYYQWTYSGKLLKYLMGISLFGYGQDTVRYYELPAHGTLLLSQKLDIVIPNGFVDGESIVFFDSPTDMMDKVKYYLAHREEADRIRLAGHEQFKKYHTTEKRAEELLKQL